MTHTGHLTALTLVIALGGAMSSAVAAQEHGGDGHGMHHGMQGERAANMAERFGTADADGDGKVSRDEMVSRMTERAAGRIETRADRMIARHDTDGDGMLTLEEMRAGPAGRMFDRLDADGDGNVSREEFAEMREARKEMRDRRSEHGSRHDQHHRGGRHGDVVIHHHYYDTEE